jgi:hypothetical protein
MDEWERERGREEEREREREEEKEREYECMFGYASWVSSLGMLHG